MPSHEQIEIQASEILLGHAVKVTTPGRVIDRAAGTGQSLASVGVGMTLRPARQIELTLDLARTLQPAQPGGQNETKLLFNLTTRF